jgi:hypothetical protein
VIRYSLSGGGDGGVFLKKFQLANAKTSVFMLKTGNKTADNEGKNIKKNNFSLQIVKTSDTKTPNNYGRLYLLMSFLRFPKIFKRGNEFLLQHFFAASEEISL